MPLEPAKYSDTLLRSLPKGHTPDDIRVFSATGVVEQVVLPKKEEELLLAKYNVARPDPINQSNKPTIMRVVAWMVHEGVNRNSQGFVKEELEAVAKDLFVAPNLGVMDFNHSAARPFSEDPKVVGVWYKAEFAYDATAGKWGILATGMLWSWLFPDHADLLLAEQERKGKISFSMACIAGSQEYIDGVEILHNPVFFTVSVLDVPPADPDAVGTGSEDVERTEEDIRKQLLAAALESPWRAAALPIPITKKQGGSMTDNELLLQKLTEDRIKAETALAELIDKYAAQSRDTETEWAAKLAAQATELEAAQTTISELETVRSGLVKELEDAKAAIEALEAQVTELAAYKAAVEEEKQVATRKATLAARIAQLPEHMQELHAAKDDEVRGRIEDKWSAMDDEKWTAYLKDELLGYNPVVHVSFLARSKAFGNLPPLPSDDTSNTDVGSRARKQLR